MAFIFRFGIDHPRTPTDYIRLCLSDTADTVLCNKIENIWRINITLSHPPSERGTNRRVLMDLLFAANKFFGLTTLIGEPWHGKQDHRSSSREYVNIEVAGENRDRGSVTRGRVRRVTLYASRVPAWNWLTVPWSRLAFVPIQLNRTKCVLPHPSLNFMSTLCLVLTEVKIALSVKS